MVFVAFLKVLSARLSKNMYSYSVFIVSRIIFVYITGIYSGNNLIDIGQSSPSLLQFLFYFYLFAFVMAFNFLKSCVRACFPFLWGMVNDQTPESRPLVAAGEVAEILRHNYQAVHPSQAMQEFVMDMEFLVMEDRPRISYPKKRSASGSLAGQPPKKKPKLD